MWVHLLSIYSSTCVHPGSFLDSSSALLAVAACTALGEMARNGPLLISAEGDGFTKLSVVENLLARIPSGKESTKVKGSGHCDSLPSHDHRLLRHRISLKIVIHDLYFDGPVSTHLSVDVHGPDEGAIDPDVRLPACGRWRLPSPEEAATGSHGLCWGMKHIGWLWYLRLQCRGSPVAQQTWVVTLDCCCKTVKFIGDWMFSDLGGGERVFNMSWRCGRFVSMFLFFVFFIEKVDCVILIH